MEYLLFEEKEILELVDEYQLYCFYLQTDIMIDQKMPTPDIIRTRRNIAPDRNPSLVVYVAKARTETPRYNEFLFKEHSIGVCGDIFKLVQELFGYSTRKEAMHRICRDFGLGGAPKSETINVLPSYERKYMDPIHIQIKSRPFNTRDFLFWDRANVDERILRMYFVKALQAFWLAEDQKIPSYPSGLGYSYEIDGRYQLYFPYTRNKAKKFRMNWGPYDIPGFHQLGPQRDLLIITKSMKDVMCLRSYGYDAIACKGENAVLMPEVIAWCKENYKRVLVLFDNDGKHKADAYEFEKIWIPKEEETDKDISDYTDNHGPKQASKLLKSLIYA